MSALERIDVDGLVPDGFEPVEALRCWAFFGGKLRSLNGTVWTPGQPLEAKCPCGAAPHEHCACGIYAATTAAQVPRTGHVYGKVKLWGKIIPGERGVRAQYAYPSAFEVPAHLVDDPALKAFGVPITVTDRKPPDGWTPQMQALTSALNISLTSGGAVARSGASSMGAGPAGAASIINVPYPLFPARNKPPTHDWLVPGVLALNLVGAAVNLSLLFHLWAP